MEWGLSRKRSFLLPPSESDTGKTELQLLKLPSSKAANCGPTAFQVREFVWYTHRLKKKKKILLEENSPFYS